MPSWPPDIPTLLYHSSFVSGRHHYECVAPNIDISLQSGRFWAMSIASFTDRFIDFRSCWIVFIHVLQGRPGGLLQFSGRKLIRSAWHLIRLTFAQCGRRGRDSYYSYTWLTVYAISTAPVVTAAVIVFACVLMKIHASGRSTGAALAANPRPLQTHLSCPACIASGNCILEFPSINSRSRLFSRWRMRARSVEQTTSLSRACVNIRIDEFMLGNSRTKLPTQSMLGRRGEFEGVAICNAERCQPCI